MARVAMSVDPAARRNRMRVVPAPGSRRDGDEPRDVEAENGAQDRALIGLDRPATAHRARTLEVVVDGWRFELEVEPTARAELRARATREAPAGARSGPVEIRAMIPGRVAAVAVAPGDAVVTGQTLLVVEAMKMQNELRAPRDGRVERLAVGVGETIDLGDLLLVLA
jgi:biotin carboxyl carrier protein